MNAIAASLCFHRSEHELRLDARREAPGPAFASVGRLAEHALDARNLVADLQGGWMHTTPRLAAPDYFTGCMGMRSPPERHQCMMDGLG